MLRFLTFCFALCLGAVSAHAATLKLVATGTVDGGSMVGPTGLVDIGDAARFEFIYDSTAPDTEAATDLGKYPGAFLSASASFGSVDVLATSGNTVQVFDASFGFFGFVESKILFSSLVGGTTPFGGPTQLTLELLDSTSAAVSDDALPTGPLDLSLFDTKRFFLSNGSVSATIDSLTITEIPPVPLPAGGALLLSAMGAFAFARRRRT